ncbi:MAG: hypothetical protein ACLFSL_03450 [Candidatus Woesearchaeota archaeon]
MVINEAAEWAAQQLKQGNSEEKIRELLIERSYTEEQADAAINEAKEKQPKKNSKKGVFLVVGMLAVFAAAGFFMTALEIPFLNDTIPEEQDEQVVPEPPQDDNTDLPTDTGREDNIEEEEDTGLDFSECTGLLDSLEQCEPFSCQVTHSKSPDVIRMEVVGEDNDTCVYATGLEGLEMTECDLPENYVDALMKSINDTFESKDNNTYTIEGDEVEDPIDKAMDEGLCE